MYALCFGERDDHLHLNNIARRGIVWFNILGLVVAVEVERLKNSTGTSLRMWVIKARLESGNFSQVKSETGCWKGVLMTIPINWKSLIMITRTKE